MKIFGLGFFAFIIIIGCSSTSQSVELEELDAIAIIDDSLKIVKTKEEWRKLLPKEVYYVTREKGTERAFSGKYVDHKESGVYACICCANELFASSTKFDSGTGWLSFYKPITSNAIQEVIDRSAGMNRVEVICARCDAHLGHVFKDGPKPTYLRYCINSIALDFISKK